MKTTGRGACRRKPTSRQRPRRRSRTRRPRRGSQRSEAGTARSRAAPGDFGSLDTAAARARARSTPLRRRRSLTARFLLNAPGLPSPAPRSFSLPSAPPEGERPEGGAGAGQRCFVVVVFELMPYASRKCPLFHVSVALTEARLLAKDNTTLGHRRHARRAMCTQTCMHAHC